LQYAGEVEGGNANLNTKPSIPTRTAINTALYLVVHALKQWGSQGCIIVVKREEQRLYGQGNSSRPTGTTHQ
jgi:hypothetical protein